MSIWESLTKILDNMENQEQPTEVVDEADKVSEEDLKKLLVAVEDKDVINEDDVLEEGKKDPKAKVRNKPSPVFSDKSSKVKDDKDHFPLGNIRQARNALARAGAFTASPKWYKGTLSSFKSAVKRAVKKAYPSVEVSKD